MSENSDVEVDNVGEKHDKVSVSSGVVRSEQEQRNFHASLKELKSNLWKERRIVIRYYTVK